MKHIYVSDIHLIDLVGLICDLQVPVRTYHELLLTIRKDSRIHIIILHVDIQLVCTVHTYL